LGFLYETRALKLFLDAAESDRFNPDVAGNFEKAFVCWRSLTTINNDFALTQAASQNSKAVVSDDGLNITQNELSSDPIPTQLNLAALLHK